MRELIAYRLRRAWWSLKWFCVGGPGLFRLDYEKARKDLIARGAYWLDPKTHPEGTQQHHAGGKP